MHATIIQFLSSSNAAWFLSLHICINIAVFCCFTSGEDFNFQVLILIIMSYNHNKGMIDIASLRPTVQGKSRKVEKNRYSKNKFINVGDGGSSQELQSFFSPMLFRKLGIFVVYNSYAVLENIFHYGALL